MFRLKHIILSAAIIALTAISSLAEVRLSGKVIDSDENPIEFASVRIAGTALGTNTNTKGEYSLSVAERDTIEVIFSCIGYEDIRRRLISPKGTMVLNAKMYSKSTQLDEVQVTEFKKQLGSMQTIDASKTKMMPDASGGSVEAIIATMAGVTSKNELSSQYMVRGGNYDENSVYINGIEVYRPLLISNGQQEGLSIINPDMVASVGFSTGGYSAEYGDKMSSVLDITYRDPEAFEGSLGLSFQGGNLMIGQGTKKFSQMHGLRYKRNSSLLGSLESKGEYDPQYFDYQTNISWRFAPKWKLSFLGNAAINNYRFTPTTRETSFGTSTMAKQFLVYFDGYEKDKFQTLFGALSLNYRHNKSSDFTFMASGYQTDELVTYDIHGEYWLDEAGGESGEGGTVGGELGVGKYHQHARDRLKASVLALSLKGNTGLGNNNLSYGVTMRHEKIYDRTKEWEWRDSAGYSLPHVDGMVNVVYNQYSSHDLSSTRLSFYALDAFKLNSDLGYFTINGGIHGSYWSFNKEFLFSPRASVGFVPARNQRMSLRFATGLYYQSPFYKEYRYTSVDKDGNQEVLLNNNIKSQRSIHFILGGDYTFRAMNRPFKFSAELYYKNLSNLISYEVENLKVVYSGNNDSKGFVTGVDFKLFGQFVASTDSWISFSLMKTQETLNGVKVPRPTDQRYSFALFFTDYFPKFPKLKLSLKALFSDGLPTTAPRGSRDKGYFRQPAYKRVDVGLSYELLGENTKRPTNALRYIKSAWVGLDFFNLFDISNVSSYYWVTDVNNLQYAVPNYLTRRQINLRLGLTF